MNRAPIEAVKDLGLTDKQRIYVQLRIQGSTKMAALRGAGYADPDKEVSEIEKRPAVAQALDILRTQGVEEALFTRKEADDMLRQAFRNAETAGEQVQAVRELIKLHGVAAPQQVEHKHNHQHMHEHEIRQLSDDELYRLAGTDSVTIDGECEVVEDTPLLESPDDAEAA